MPINVQNESGLIEETTPGSNPEHAQAGGRRGFLKTAAATVAGFAASTAVAAIPTKAETTTSRSNPALTKHHEALHDFAGKWDVTQKQWKAPNADPVVVKGSSVATASMGGLMVSIETKMEDGWKGTAIQTFNASTGCYELALMNTGTSGIVTMLGEHTPGPATVSIQNEHGPSARQVRTWAASSIVPAHTTTRNVRGVFKTAALTESSPDDSPVSLCTAPSASVAPTAFGEAPGLMLVEHKISPDKWVLDFYLAHASGDRTLVQQSTFTRNG